MRPSAFVAAASVALLVAARAQAGDSAAAQALFDDAQRLMSQHQFAEACSKFEESQKLDPGMGTLFHLADCEERVGKTASAWAMFLEVASETKAHGEAAREQAARDRAAALESRLSRLMIDPGAESRTPGLELVRDGTPVGPGQWTIAVPVDPGAHVVEAHAPGKGSWRTTVNLGEGARQTVTVPLLADAPVAAAAEEGPLQAKDARLPTTTSAEVSAASGNRGSGQRVAGIVIGAVGIAGLGVGGYYGISSILHHRDADPHCAGNVCDATGVSERDQARDSGNVATIALAAGGAGLLAGILTYATAPRAHDAVNARNGGAGAQVGMSVGPGSVLFSGTW